MQQPIKLVENTSSLARLANRVLQVRKRHVIPRLKLGLFCPGDHIVYFLHFWISKTIHRGLGRFSTQNKVVKNSEELTTNKKIVPI
jgi:hypothetical protein